MRRIYNIMLHFFLNKQTIYKIHDNPLLNYSKDYGNFSASEIRICINICSSVKMYRGRRNENNRYCELIEDGKNDRKCKIRILWRFILFYSERSSIRNGMLLLISSLRLRFSAELARFSFCSVSCRIHRLQLCKMWKRKPRARRLNLP